MLVYNVLDLILEEAMTLEAKNLNDTMHQRRYIAR